MISQDDHDDVTAWMAEFARSPLESPPPIDPSLLWWKAQLMRRFDAERRAVVPIEIGEQVQVGVGVVAAFLLLGWLWRVLTPARGGTSFALAILVCSAVLGGVAMLVSWERRNARLN